MSVTLNGLVESTADPNAHLENALMDEYLHTKGDSLEDLKKLPKELVEKLMKEASPHAFLKTEEVQARAHLVSDCTRILRRINDNDQGPAGICFVPAACGTAKD